VAVIETTVLEVREATDLGVQEIVRVVHHALHICLAKTHPLTVREWEVGGGAQGHGGEDTAILLVARPVQASEDGLSLAREVFMAHEPTRRVHVEEDRTETPVVRERRTTTYDSAYATRVILQLVYLLFGIFEVLLLIRFIMKLGNANSANGVISALYGVTEPLVRPFYGIFPQPGAGAQLEIAALLSLAFLVLVEALIVAVIRALTPRYY